MKGSPARLQGWGIRTLEDIPSGSFVMEYVGEIITNEMAEVSSSFSSRPSQLKHTRANPHKTLTNVPPHTHA